MALAQVLALGCSGDEGIALVAGRLPKSLAGS
jgi:hypothetical protein